MGHLGWVWIQTFHFFLLLCPLLLAVSPQPAPKLKRIKEEDENGKSK